MHSPGREFRRLVIHSPSSCISASWRGVATGHGIADALTALPWLQAPVDFDLGSLAREFVILDDASEPGRIVTRAQVMFPGAVVDPLGDLEKQHQVLSAEIEGIIRPAKIETEVLAEFPFGIFSRVPPVRLPRTDGLH